jgi:hypothetical protein
LHYAHFFVVRWNPVDNNDNAVALAADNNIADNNKYDDNITDNNIADPVDDDASQRELRDLRKDALVAENDVERGAARDVKQCDTVVSTSAIAQRADVLWPVAALHGWLGKGELARVVLLDSGFDALNARMTNVAGCESFIPLEVLQMCVFCFRRTDNLNSSLFSSARVC